MKFIMNYNYIWSVMNYGAKKWTLRKEEKKRLEET